MENDDCSLPMRVLTDPIITEGLADIVTMEDADRVLRALWEEYDYADYMRVCYDKFDGKPDGIASIYVDSSVESPLYYKQYPEESPFCILRQFTDPKAMIYWVEGFMQSAVIYSDEETARSQPGGI